MKNGKVIFFAPAHQHKQSLISAAADAAVDGSQWLSREAIPLDRMPSSIAPRRVAVRFHRIISSVPPGRGIHLHLIQGYRKIRSTPPKKLPVKLLILMESILVVSLLNYQSGFCSVECWLPSAAPLGQRYISAQIFSIYVCIGT